MPSLKYYDIGSGSYKYLTGGMSQAYADTRYIQKSGDAMTGGDLTLFRDPSSSMHSVTKQYVDNRVIRVYSSTTARDIAIPIGSRTDGMMAFTSDTRTLWIWSSSKSAWLLNSQRIASVSRTTDTTVTTSADYVPGWENVGAVPTAPFDTMTTSLSQGIYADRPGLYFAKASADGKAAAGGANSATESCQIFITLDGGSGDYVVPAGRGINQVTTIVCTGFIPIYPGAPRWISSKLKAYTQNWTTTIYDLYVHQVA